MKVDLSTYNNAWFKPTIGASTIKRMVWYIFNIIFLNNSLIVGSPFKRWLLRGFGARIGRGVVIKPGVNIKYPWKLQVGDYVWLGENVWIDNLDNVVIGNNVCISQGAMLLTGNHDYNSKSFDLIIGKIILDDGVWIGAKALVGPGVRCEEQSVLSAMSVATKNLEANTIYQGNPALPKRTRFSVQG